MAVGNVQANAAGDCVVALQTDAAALSGDYLIEAFSATLRGNDGAGAIVRFALDASAPLRTREGIVVDDELRLSPSVAPVSQRVTLPLVVR